MWRPIQDFPVGRWAVQQLSLSIIVFSGHQKEPPRRQGRQKEKAFLSFFLSTLASWWFFLLFVGHLPFRRPEQGVYNQPPKVLVSEILGMSQRGVEHAAALVDPRPGNRLALLG